MNLFRLLLLLFAVPGALLAQTPGTTKSKPSPLEWNTSDHSPRSRALELAGGFSGDGYKVRDGFWSGSLEKGTPVLIEVNLFAGNDYWFSAANLDPSTRLKVSIFDVHGNPVGSQAFDEASRAAAGISVWQSGRYFIRVAMTEGDKADTCMVYSYK